MDDAKLQTIKSTDGGNLFICCSFLAFRFFLTHMVKIGGRQFWSLGFNVVFDEEIS